MAESVAGVLGVAPDPGDNRSTREVAVGLSATDGAASRATSLRGAGRGVTVLEGSGTLLDSREGRTGVEGVSRRRASMRSSSELRERLPRSEAVGADARGARSVALSDPIRPAILPVPLERGESLCRGTDKAIDDSDLCEPIGAPMRPAFDTLGLGVLTNGRDGLDAIDRPGLDNEFEGAVGVGLLDPTNGLDGALGVGLLDPTDGLDGALGAGLLVLGVDGRSLMACCRPERPPEVLGVGADLMPIDGLGRLMTGGLLRTLEDGALGA